MELSKKHEQQQHVEAIFKEYTTPSRVLRSFTNLSNTVIQTALSGQSKFVFEILQNADDAFEDEHKAIEVKFILHDNYLIVHHNGKGFDFNDVERICDYASQIEEVKATDLSKTGYKGLGFKSLFNLSDCIYIYSNGYSFRFDKAYLPDAESKPWQIIPIWCEYDKLPLHKKYSYNQPVNFILKVKDINQLEVQLREIVDQPELLLYMFRINKFSVNLNGEEHFLERKVEKCGVFNKIDFYKNKQIASTWLSKAFKCSVPEAVQTSVQGANRFIYPDKIKKAKEVPFTFSVRSDKTLQTISKVRGLCYSTLPTQLHLTLPYHINSLFILNLDRTQLHENEWNEFLLYQIGQLQLSLLKDLAEVNYLKNYVIELFVREIHHPYGTFCKAFLKGFVEAKGQIGWLPAHRGSRLLKLGEAWIDETEFFKQSFQNIRDYKSFPFLIEYDLRSQNCLRSSEEAKRFTFVDLFRDFASKYYPQLTKGAYISFITYLYKRLKGPTVNTYLTNMLSKVHFLKAKDGNLLSPMSALLEESKNPVPDFLMLNLVDNEYLPTNNIELIKDWLALLGAKRLTTPIQVLRESILQWIDSGSLKVKITLKNHIGIMNFLAKGMNELSTRETRNLRERLLILTEGNKFQLANLCYLPEAASTVDLADFFISDAYYIISSSYNLKNLREFFISVGVHHELNPIHVILRWIDSGNLNSNITLENHIRIINHLAKRMDQLTTRESRILKEGMIILTESNKFKLANLCYLPDAISPQELADIAISDADKISSSYDLKYLRGFFIHVGVHWELNPINMLRNNILVWIRSGQIKHKMTISNYKPILEYVASHYPDQLTVPEKKEFKKIPVFTSGQSFQEAQVCYFDSAVLKVKGLEGVISENELVSTDSISNSVRTFLKEMGVSAKIDFVDVLRRSVLRWIQIGDIVNKITVENHQDILKYIADKWVPPGLKAFEKDILKVIPILTRSGKFRPACSCYWPNNLDGKNCKGIPILDSIISSEELISSDYVSVDVKSLLRDLGVKNLTFTEVYEKYSDHLTCDENIKWFFSELLSYFNKCLNYNADKLLTCLQQKFKTASRLLAKNGEMYSSTELYSLQFDTMHDIDPYSVPLLKYEKLPVDLERWLGFKTALDLKCITQLLKAFEKKPKLGEERTIKFFTTLLEQLRQKDSSEIKKYQLRLLSKENKLKPAEHLYYFIEEEATCHLDSWYLKRIHGMSHAETLELAELCGVHTIPFEQKVTPEEKTNDNTLKEFYQQRLPFIVVQESRELNENPSATLRRLYDAICSIELYKCINIYVHYPFGNPIKVKHHFQDLTFFTNVKWKKIRTPIHQHLKEKLHLTTNIEYIIDMDEIISKDDRQDWLNDQGEEDRRAFYLIEEELRKLSNEGKDVSESLEIGQPQSIGKEKHFVDSALLENKQPIAAESSSGVDTIPFKGEITREGDTYDKTLKEFYLQRLPFIVVQESRELNENPIFTLRRLYDSICTIELYKCLHIYVQCPLGNRIEIPHHFEDLKFCADVKWNKIKTPIHQYLKEKLNLKTNIDYIIDMEETISKDDRQDWLKRQKEEDRKKFYLIEKEFFKLCNEVKEDVSEIVKIGGTGIHGSFLSETGITDYESTTGSNLESIIEIDSSSIQVLQKHVSMKRKQVVSEREKVCPRHQSGNKEKRIKGSYVEDELCIRKHAIQDEDIGTYSSFLYKPEATTYETTPGSKLIRTFEFGCSSIQILQKRVFIKRKPVVSESGKVDQPHQCGNKGKHFTGSEIESKNRIAYESFINRCYMDFSEDEQPSAPRQHTIEDGVGGNFFRKPEASTRREFTSGTILENVIEVLKYLIQVLQDLVTNEPEAATRCESTTNSELENVIAVLNNAIQMLQDLVTMKGRMQSKR